jgi:anaerobic magnesium-protoporphyrin IX monomethyl ester cyclase
MSEQRAVAMNTRPILLVLIQPPLPANERHKKVLPLGLGYLASVIRRGFPDASVAILDAQVRNLDLEETLKEASSLGGPDTIWGITYWTAQAPFAHELSLRLKDRFPDSIVIHGGVHTTIYPEESLKSADYAILHEGEISFIELVRCLLKKTAPSGVKGIAFKQDGKVVKTATQPFIENLDSIPFPAWDLLDMERYDTPLHVVGGHRVPIVGSRGCPYRCIYCGSPLMWGRKVRWRSPESVLDEMEEIIRRYGISQFHFWDDNLLLNRSYVEGLCEGIRKRNMKVRWTGLTRASHITNNADLVPLLAKSGCIGLEIGIESANPNTFKEIEKQEDLRNILEVARLHKGNNIYPLFTYMAFNPGETISGYYRQARFIDKIHEGLPLPDFWVHHFPFSLYIGQMCTPHPGTKLFQEAPNLGAVLAKEWSDYHHHQINFVPNSLLDDTPVKNMKQLRDQDIPLCLWALYDCFWPDFCASVPEKEQDRTLSKFDEAIRRFWQLADGKRTVREIAESLASDPSITSQEAMRFGAFICLIFGQLGLIKSNSEKGDVRPITAVREDQIPFRFRRRNTQAIDSGERQKKEKLPQKYSVTLYIPCFNAEKTLARCLESVKAQTYPIDEVIVIDDGSKDRTAAIAHSFGVRVISQGRNLGLGVTRNRAAKEARNECVAEPDWLERLMKHFEDKAVVGACGKLVEKNQATLADAWRAVHMPQHWGEERITNPYFLFGADNVYRKSALLEIGLFDERHRTNFEDVDMGIRLSRAGKKSIYDPSAIALHLKTDTPMSAIRAYYCWYSPNYPEPRTLRNLAHRWWIYCGDFCNMLRKDLQARRYDFSSMDLLLWLYRTGFDTKRLISRS